MQNNSIDVNFEKLNFDDGVVQVVDGVLQKYKDIGRIKFSEIRIPEGVTDLGKYSIAVMDAEVMYVPASVEIIRSNSIIYAYELKRIYIENPNICLEMGCINDLPKLKEIYIGGQKIDAVITRHNKDEDSIQLERYIGTDKSYKIEDDITVIGIRAFYNCETLEKVEFSQSVCTIMSCAFEGCKALKEVQLPENLKFIVGGAFKGCKAIKEFTVPRSVISLGVGAFEGWRRRQTIRVPLRYKTKKNLQEWRNGCKAKIKYY